MAGGCRLPDTVIAVKTIKSKCDSSFHRVCFETVNYYVYSSHLKHFRDSI